MDVVQSMVGRMTSIIFCRQVQSCLNIIICKMLQQKVEMG